MYKDLPNSSYDDLILFAYELPPVADPDRYTIDQAAVRFPSPAFAEANIGDKCHMVIGITAAGWMMIEGVGWRLIKADRTVAHKIASACNGLQRHLLTNRKKFDHAYDRHVSRADQNKIAGLVLTPLEPGRYIVRFNDITSRQTKDRLFHYLKNAPHRNDTDDPFCELPDGYIGSEVWWRFAWMITHSPEQC